ncbi:uncharacterized protein LOC131165020 [Malania oleifera]|uniref:uncharacterized protein LOC131165020 n=1 Tax=Malania oleifera TaxID=397392 RepID=UPI0025AE8949|nr:uncharacterized protein LOC131165020 [Malania oleifera]
MEPENNAGYIPPATNWTVAGGSLESSVVVETSASPIDEAAVGSSRPLFLHSAASDPCPCEITISFPQKHEIRQIYVRSSARVFEIYYAADPQSSNEYLCTVRCSIAAKNEELLHTVNGEEVVSEQLRELNKQLNDEKIKTDNDSSNNEDEWVQVKVPDSLPLDDGNSSLPTKIDTNQERNTQVLFEATAEISDANPCISLTLRLLSLQNKGCVYVDEIYVFADTVESSNLGSQGGPMENSTGNSLIAMLVPTLLQISKTSGNRIQEKQVSDKGEEQKFQEFGLEATDSTNAVKEIQLEGSARITVQQEIKLPEVGGVSFEESQLQTPSQVSDEEKKREVFAVENNLPYIHLERTLDQLVSRVGKIEDICLRFEESMLRPISSIEARLQRVEQQLEVLSKKSQHTESPSCSRFSAPEFTCTESDSNSFYNGGGVHPSCGALESDKPDNSPEKLCDPPDDMSVLVKSKTDNLAVLLDDTPALLSAIQSLPTLVVTAPEFSNADDEIDNDALELVTDSMRTNTKKTLSIDDALANALAGFLTSTSLQPLNYTPILTVNAPEFSSGDYGNDNIIASPLNYTPILTVNAPEFSSGDYGNDNIIASPKIECDVPPEPAIRFGEMDGTECTEDSVSTSCGISLESREKFKTFLKENDIKEIGEVVDSRGCQCFDGVVNCRDIETVNEHAQAEHVVAKTNNNQMTKEINAGEASNGTGNFLDFDLIYIPVHFHGDQTDDSSHDTRIGTGADLTTETSAGEASKGASNFLDSDNMYIPLHFLGDRTDDSPHDVQEGTDASSDSTAAANEVTEEESNKDTLQEVLNLSNSLSTLDFEIPILDVNFTSQENSHLKFSLEALLTDRHESNAEASCAEESDTGLTIGEQCKLIVVEDVEDPATANDPFAHLGYYDATNVLLHMEGDNQQDNDPSSNPEMSSATLI